MKKILVTGANGFVGSHILAALQQHEVEVIAACRNKNSLPEWFKGEVREGDLRDPAYIESALQDIDTVCHAAAWTSLWSHEKQSQELYMKPSLALLDACVQKGTSRFINISTTSAAAPDGAHDAHSPGIIRPFWPHLTSVITIENAMRQHASAKITMINLRCGIFAGERYGLGILPILLPRLKTHLVPWVAGGKTGLPIIDGTDIGKAFALASINPALQGFESFNIVGPATPSLKQVITFLHTEYGYPLPHFSVPFPIAYAFAWLMEKLDNIVPWEPLITRSIIHLIEETGTNNESAKERLGYQPSVHWKDAIRKQLSEMHTRQEGNMRMYRPYPKMP